ncbi:hypothetical protein Cgig2_009831 [Carnegiea gigantea]|uniref:IP5PC-F beta-propeller domain-containing protein n=1 Tax=Carnegiea gigantea TaxID=171969 RepID=A0A9Q1QKR0_9CARY|nr:hypothetical protein Cgig2_009831 [Carnegiea gigantea]
MEEVGDHSGCSNEFGIAVRNFVRIPNCRGRLGSASLVIRDAIQHIFDHEQIANWKENPGSRIGSFRGRGASQLVADAGDSNAGDSNGRFSRVSSAAVVRAFPATPMLVTSDCLLSLASQRLQLLTPANQFCQLYLSPCDFTGEGEGEGEEDVRVGDEMTAPFWESAEASEVTCMVADKGGGVVWSGHKDGRIRCWRTEMDQRRRRENGVRECLSWQAHRGPDLSMVITSYGKKKKKNSLDQMWIGQVLKDLGLDFTNSVMNLMRDVK